MSAANCTFNFTSAGYGATASATGLNAAFSYVSNCHEDAAGADYYSGTTKYTTTTSTATIAQFLLFDAVNIYYNDTLYFSINATNAASVGFTPATFFAGKQDTTYVWPAATTFATVIGILE